MFTHSEQRLLPYTPEQLFALVADVERYPEFLPWCLAARVRHREESEERTVIVADLAIGFRMIRERFTSRVALARPGNRIDVTYTEGPFKFLRNSWVFVPVAEGQCRIEFHVEFEFRSAVLQALMGVVFHEAVRRMVGAFETRARALYGPPAQQQAPPGG
jgi:coenzyme Q-binding protein COQ10